MQKIWLLFIMCVCAQGSEKSPKSTVAFPAGGTLNFTVYVNNNQDAKSSTATNIVSHQIDQKKECSKALLKKFIEPATQFSQSVSNRITSSSSNFISNYTWHILGVTTVAAYLSLVYYLWSGNRYLSDPALWSSWRQDLSFEQLLAIPQHQMAQDLLKEIQRRYSDSESLLDATKPLVTFMMHIEQEEQQLKSYSTRFSWISYLKLNKIVPLSAARFNKLTERLQRLTYFKNTFQTWASNYQLEQVVKEKQRRNRALVWYTFDPHFALAKSNAQLRAIMQNL